VIVLDCCAWFDFQKVNSSSFFTALWQYCFALLWWNWFYCYWFGRDFFFIKIVSCDWFLIYFLEGSSRIATLIIIRDYFCSKKNSVWSMLCFYWQNAELQRERISWRGDWTLNYFWLTENSFVRSYILFVFFLNSKRVTYLIQTNFDLSDIAIITVLYSYCF
jgi:hypothetical protein